MPRYGPLDSIDPGSRSRSQDDALVRQPHHRSGALAAAKGGTEIIYPPVPLRHMRSSGSVQQN